MTKMNQKMVLTILAFIHSSVTFVIAFSNFASYEKFPKIILVFFN